MLVSRWVQVRTYDQYLRTSKWSVQSQYTSIYCYQKWKKIVGIFYDNKKKFGFFFMQL